MNKIVLVFSLRTEFQDAEWDTATDLLAPLTRDFAERLGTSLDEVKHQEELKHQHSEPLAGGRLLHAMLY
jgi:hypothetical protein